MQRRRMAGWVVPLASPAADDAAGGVAQAGRAKKHLPNDLMTLREVQAALSRALKRVEAGEMEAGPANAMASLARAIAVAAEAGDLEQRLTALDERAGVVGRTA